MVVAAGTEADFLAPLPVARLWGVGRVTAEELEAIGLQTIGQLAAVPAELLEARFGPGSRGSQEFAHGRDDRPVEPFAAPKSMGAEETFGDDHRDVDRLHATLRAQAERVARELRAEGYAGRCVTLKLRFADFSTLTRRHTDEPTQDGLAIYRRARAAARPDSLFASPCGSSGFRSPRWDPPRPASCRCSARTPRAGSGWRAPWIGSPLASARSRCARPAWSGGPGGPVAFRVGFG